MGELYDEIGPWSEIKLDILRDYATEYSKILTVQATPSLSHVYVDAFAGPGQHISRTTGEFVTGSPTNALNVVPPFREYHFIDIESARVEALQRIAQQRSDVHLHTGNCNDVLLHKVFPKMRYEDYRRGLCVLDPYGLHLEWRVIATAAQMKSMEIFLNFPVADMNRNVLWRQPERVAAEQADRMTSFWGDASWREVAYTTSGNLFGWEEKTDNDTIAEAFRQRLMTVAGFRYVPMPLPFKNSKDATVYYLFFASHKPVARKIVEYIFDKYR